MTALSVSRVQRQYWLLNRIYPDTGAYNLFSVFEVSSAFDSEVFLRAVNLVVNRHEGLRVSFSVENDTLIQTISDFRTDMPIVVVDEDFEDHQTNSHIYKEVNESFDLSVAPLFRLKMFRFNDGRDILCLTFHHIIADIRTEQIFSNEVSSAYNAFVSNIEPFSDPYPFQFTDYLSEITAWYEGPDYMDRLSRLAETYSNPDSKIELRVDCLEAPTTRLDGSGMYFQLETDLSRRVEVYAEKTGKNSFRILLAAYAIFLWKLSGQDSVTICVPLSNRTRTSSKWTFGCFVNALPLRIYFRETQTVEDVLDQVCEQLQGNLDLQEIPFQDLVSSNHFRNTS